MKFVTFVSAPPNQTWRTFQDWFIRDHVPAIVKGAPNLRAGLVRRRVDAPDPALAPTPIDPRNGIAPADIILETWMSSAEDFRREMLPLEQRLREIGARHISYAVDPRLHKDPRIAEAGPSGKRPEITYVISLRYKPTVSKEYAQREYLEHVGLSLRLQPAVARYEQNYVTEVMSWTPDTPAIDVFSDFSFRTIADMLARYRVTEEEVQDTSTFVAMFHAAFYGDAEPFAG